MDKLAISVQDVSKSYQIGASKSNSLREELGKRVKGIFGKDESKDTFMALEDISFEVNRGEIIGIVGKNGAGKSTLLKVLSRITHPSAGKIDIHGRVASLLEVGTGFHPELTGRENIMLNGTILGMSRNEVKSKFDEIVEFSGVGKFIDTPVKRYSSGMYVRLAFSVAAHLEPEVLIIDEVLAVGDAEFQKKCLGKMDDVAKSGRTVLFVSHNMGAVTELCTRAIFLEHGKMKKDGSVSEVIEHYLRNASMSNSASIELPEIAEVPRSISKISILNADQKLCKEFQIDQAICVAFEYEVFDVEASIHMEFRLDRFHNYVFTTFDTDVFEAKEYESPGRYKAVVDIPGWFLKAGTYYLTINIMTLPEGNHFQSLESVLDFQILDDQYNTARKGFRTDRAGDVVFPGKWKINKL